MVAPPDRIAGSNAALLFGFPGTRYLRVCACKHALSTCMFTCVADNAIAHSPSREWTSINNSDKIIERYGPRRPTSATDSRSGEAARAGDGRGEGRRREYTRGRGPVKAPATPHRNNLRRGPPRRAPSCE
ncbi:hypothetical protein EVAR_100841_1 [Eumeta japonica]|uniref:Uncharacterized protein n=1 Tax=Eumeta variegata TaxID=151549 RepID=A0A4C2AAF5_EUMVA|nr:hypothetical protein EVAR_100841_1 [Eumeta japonica]